MLHSLLKLSKILQKYNISTPDLDILIAQIDEQYKVGDTVNIVNGRYKGLKGKILDIEGADSASPVFTIGIDMFGRLVSHRMAKTSLGDVIKREEPQKINLKELARSDYIKFFEYTIPHFDELNEPDIKLFERTLKKCIESIFSTLLYGTGGQGGQNRANQLLSILHPFFKEHPEYVNNNLFQTDELYNLLFDRQLTGYEDIFTREVLRKFIPSDYTKENVFARVRSHKNDPDFKEFINQYKDLIEDIFFRITDGRPDIYFHYRMDQDPEFSHMAEGMAFELLIKDPVKFLKYGLDIKFPHIDRGSWQEQLKNTRTRAAQVISLSEPAEFFNLELYNDFPQLVDISLVKLKSNPEFIRHFLQRVGFNSPHIDDIKRKILDNIIDFLVEKKNYAPIFENQIDSIYKDLGKKIALELYTTDQGLFKSLDLYKKYRNLLPIEIGDTVFILEGKYAEKEGKVTAINDNNTFTVATIEDAGDGQNFKEQLLENIRRENVIIERKKSETGRSNRGF